MAKSLHKISKFIALILRHKPETVGLKLDKEGYVPVDSLLNGLAKVGSGITAEDLKHIVETDNKHRYAFSDDGRKIRASQGHSIPVDIKFEAATPPAILYHGTATRFCESILKQGILKGKRNHVHLSALESTAKAVGARHGDPLVFHIDAADMAKDGFKFYLSANGVWLTDHVPASYIIIV